MKSPILILVLSLFVFSLQGQKRYRFTDDTPPALRMKSGSTQLSNPFAGGLLSPHFSNFDLDEDGVEDVVIIDGQTDKILTFLSRKEGGNAVLVYAPEYEVLLPASAQKYLHFIDYNRDGKKDIFTASGGDVAVYKNVTRNGVLAFEKIYDELRAYDPEINFNVNVLVQNPDILSMADVDFDGDMDLIFFDSGADVQFYENKSNESGKHPDSLILEVNAHCWGRFSESSISNELFLDAGCSFNNLTTESTVAHTGSNLLPIDLDGDKDLDMLISDISYPIVKALYNGRDPLSATPHRRDSMYKIIEAWPEKKPINVPVFPIMSYLDIDQDGVKDLVVSPADVDASLDQKSLWLYEGQATKDSVRLAFKDSSFLRNQMLDLGLYTIPAFGDISGDGIADLLVSYIPPFSKGEQLHFRLAYFKRSNNKDGAASFDLENADYLGFSNSKPFFIHPSLGDVDGDGKVDLVLGNEKGQLLFYKNKAASGAANFELENSNFQSIDVGNNSTPCLFDYNDDKRLDLVIGESNGNLNYFQQKADGSFEFITDSFGLVKTRKYQWQVIGGDSIKRFSVNGQSTPSLGDVDGNERPDMIVGSDHGELYFFRDISATPGAEFPQATRYYFNSVSGEIYNKDFGRAVSMTPALSDMDGDGLDDLLIGDERGGLSYMRAKLVDLAVGEKSRPRAQALKPRIYPNPATSSVSIEFNEALPERIEFYNAMGALVSTIRPTGLATEISVSSWQPGIYIIKSYGAEVVSGERILIR